MGVKIFVPSLPPSPSPPSTPCSPSVIENAKDDDDDEDDDNENDNAQGAPWTEEEHGTFLAGLEMLGKGDWRGISRNFVTTRTPTQVASHAQKYFLRQNSINKKKRRSNPSDVVGNCERAVHVPDDMSRSKDLPSLGDLQFPALSLNMTAN